MFKVIINMYSEFLPDVLYVGYEMHGVNYVSKVSKVGFIVMTFLGLNRG